MTNSIRHTLRQKQLNFECKLWTTIYLLLFVRVKVSTVCQEFYKFRSIAAAIPANAHEYATQLQFRKKIWTKIVCFWKEKREK